MRTDGFNKIIYDWFQTTSELKVGLSLQVIIKNQFPYQENEWIFYFWNPTAALC